MAILIALDAEAAEAMSEGRSAFVGDGTLLDNPYWPPDGDALLEAGLEGWDDGWCEAFRQSIIASPVM
jgi:hypothetical protein